MVSVLLICVSNTLFVLILGFRGKYLQLNIVVSSLLLLVHAIWHSVLAGFAPYGRLLEEYPIIQKIGYNLGLVSYRGIDPLMAIHYLAPEVSREFEFMYIPCISSFYSRIPLL